MRAQFGGCACSTGKTVCDCGLSESNQGRGPSGSAWSINDAIGASIFVGFVVAFFLGAFS
jgi:hypothetical protein